MSLAALAGSGLGCSLLSLDSLDAGSGSGGGTGSAATVGSTTSGEGPASTSTGDGGAAAGTGMSAIASQGSGGTGGAGGETGAGGAGTGGAGAGGGVVSPCQHTPLLDDFDRPDGPLGRNWIEGNGLAVASNRLEEIAGQGGYHRALWSQPFGASQEAHVTLSHIDFEAEEQLLLLQAQGNANIEVLYAPDELAVEVWTCTPGCTRVASIGAIPRDGARLAARSDGLGQLAVCLDGEQIADVDVTAWAPYFRNGGRIGVGTLRQAAGSAVFAFDDFGGGTTP